MSRHTAKIIPFTVRQREVRGRLTSTGEVLRTTTVARPRPDDEGPRAA